MSFTDKKITSEDIASQGVQSKPNKLTGTAAENKKAFDNLVSAVVREKFNAFLEELMGASGWRTFGSNTEAEGRPIDPFASESATVDFEVEFPMLAAGEYFLVAAVHLGKRPAMFELIWHDFAAPLVSARTVFGGILRVPVRIEVKGNAL